MDRLKNWITYTP